MTGRGGVSMRLAKALLMVLAAAALMVPGTAGAQATTAYVSNLSQASDSLAMRNTNTAQAFTTGSNTGGYQLTSVEIDSQDPESDSFAASVCTVDTSGNPTASCIALTAPSSFAAGLLSFTPPANTTLAANTTYAVLMTIESGDIITFDTTSSDDQDSGASSGWSIANAYRFLSGDSWHTPASSYAIRIAIRGTTGANSAPTVANAIPDQTATADTAFSYAFPANTFADADSDDTLTYTAARDDDSALPSWLTFSASTRTFSGTPQSGDAGTVSVKVKADDSNGGTVTDAFDITVSGTDTATPTRPFLSQTPQIASPGSDCVWKPGEKVEITLTFNEAVNVDTSGGTPSVTFDYGYRNPKSATYDSGSGTTDLKFTYDVATTDHTTFWLIVMGDTLTLNGGSITSAADSARSVDLDNHLGPRAVAYWGLHQPRSVRCAPWPDTTKPRPTITGVEIGGAWTSGGRAGTWSDGRLVDVWLTFSEPVQVWDGDESWRVSEGDFPALKIKTDFGGDKTATWSNFGDRTNRMLFRYKPVADDGSITQVEVVANSLVLNDLQIRSVSSGQPAVVTHAGEGSVTQPTLLVGNQSETRAALVSNTEELSSLWAQKFTTGSEAVTLSGVRLRGSFTDAVKVSIYDEDSAGNPGFEMAALDNPAGLTNLPRSGNFYFSAPGGVVLGANITYWVHIEEVNAGSVTLEETAATGETGESGWSVADSYLHGTVSWNTDTDSLMLALYGTPADSSVVGLVDTTSSTQEAYDPPAAVTALGQRFTTAGPAVLDKVELRLAGTTADAVITIHEDKVGQPTEEAVGTLNEEDRSFVTSSTQHYTLTFQATGHIPLKEYTTYWLVFKGTLGEMTVAGELSTQAQPGWSIETHSWVQQGDGATWQITGPAWRMELSGVPQEPTNPPSAPFFPEEGVGGKMIGNSANTAVTGDRPKLSLGGARAFAQSFQTGFGSILAEVRIHGRFTHHTRVAIHANDSGVPGNRLATLQNPVYFTNEVSAERSHRFRVVDEHDAATASAGGGYGLPLANNTTYWVVVSRAGFLGATESEDEEGADGWSIGSRLQAEDHDGDWADYTNAEVLLMDIWSAPTEEPSGAIELVGNLPNASDGGLPITALYSGRAQSFTAGSDARLTSVTLRGEFRDATVVTIHEDSSNLPGTAIAALQNPAGLTSSLSPDGAYDFTVGSSPISLDAGTRYWVVLTGGGEFDDTTDSGTTGLSGWSLGSSARQSATDSTWESRTTPFRLSVRGIPGGGSSEASAADPPTITGAPAVSASGSDGEWGPGETVEVTLTFSEAVTVDTGGGTPSVAISLGGTAARSAAYLRGSGTTELVFGYTLSDLDGSHTSMFVTPNGLALNDGTIRSQATGVDADLNHAGKAESGSATGTRDEDDNEGEPPPAPTSLAATVNSDGHVVLTWTAPADDSVTGYQVLRRRPAQGENTLQVYVSDTGSTSTTYTDTNVTAGTQHVYRVKAINAAGMSGRSNYVNVTPQAPQSQQAPPAPTNLTATVNDDGHVVLTWTAPDDDSVTGYVILRRRPAEGENSLQVYVADTGSTATTYTDTNVTAGTQHVYRVKAINAAGQSGRSNYVNVTP